MNLARVIPWLAAISLVRAAAGEVRTADVARLVEQVGELQTALDLTTKQLLRTTQDLEAIKLDMNQRLINQERELKRLEQRNVKSEQLITDLVKSNAEKTAAGVVSFSVYLPDGSHTLPSTGTIMYTSIDHNVGGAFDPVTSLVTAPVEGYYLIHVSLHTLDSDSSFVDAFLYMNGAPIQSDHLHPYPDYISAAMGGVLHLQPGDTVSVVMTAGDYLYCEYKSCRFDGYLLREVI